MSCDVKCADCINVAGLRTVPGARAYKCTVRGAHDGLISSLYHRHPCGEYMFYD